jgi:LysM repeat protein
LSASAAPENNFQNQFAALMEAVQRKLDEGRLSEAHLALSTLYDNPDLPPAQARQVTELLDQLAGTVIYSRQHILEQPCIVQPGETLDQIANRYSVPALLLARINGISDPQRLEPGRQLKVVRGPFDAVIHLERHEVSLLVSGRYAGRFSIGVGCDQPKLEGTYVVSEKTVNPVYHGPNGVTVPGGDPRNPLGKFWIGLSQNIGIHGTVDPQNIGRDDNRGTICLGDRDIDDLYGILSVGSRVVIQR